MLTFRGLLLSSASVLALTLVVNAQSTVQYTVLNKCTGPVDLYIAESFDRTLAPGASSVHSLGASAGFFYTNANGGVANSQSNSRAGFVSGDNVSDVSSANPYVVPTDIPGYLLLAQH